MSVKKANNDLMFLAAVTVVIVAAFVVMTGFSGSRSETPDDLSVLGATSVDAAGEAEFADLEQEAAGL